MEGLKVSIRDDVLSEGLAAGVQDEYAEQFIQPVEQQEGPSFIDILKSPTGEGDIVPTYTQHVLNFNKSESMGRIIRGLTGLLGNLNYAIADIAIGFFQMQHEKKNAGA